MMLRYFMLTNGYELIGEIEDGEQYDLRKLKNPWRLLLSNRGYMPVPCPAGEIELERVHILLEGTVDDDLAAVYHEKYNGIITPPKSMVFPN